MAYILMNYFSNLLVNFLQQVIELVDLDIGSAKSSRTSDLPEFGGLDPNTMFWERTMFVEGVIYKLKTVCTTGYEGKGLDVEFFKYLITNARMIERITICFDDCCTWKAAAATVCLLSLASASVNLSITLKPGKEYLAKVGGSFGDWISSLRLN